MQEKYYCPHSLTKCQAVCVAIGPISCALCFECVPQKLKY